MSTWVECRCSACGAEIGASSKWGTSWPLFEAHIEQCPYGGEKPQPVEKEDA